MLRIHVIATSHLEKTEKLLQQRDPVMDVMLTCYHSAVSSSHGRVCRVRRG